MEIDERIRLASGSAEQLGAVLHDRAPEVLEALVNNPNLDEEHVLLLLARRDLPGAAISVLASREPLLRSYRVKAALTRHANAPRTVTLGLLRHLQLPDLVAMSLTPAAPGDIKRVAEDAVLNRLPALNLGERVNMARRCTGRVAGALLADREMRVVNAALENPRLTGELVVKALSLESISAEAVERIATHRRWSTAYEVRLALLRQPLTTLGRVLALAPEVKRNDLREVAGDPRMPLERRTYLTRLSEKSTP